MLLNWFASSIIGWTMLRRVGNGFGLGALRRKESFASYEILGVPPEKIEVIDHPYVLLMHPNPG